MICWALCSVHCDVWVTGNYQGVGVHLPSEVPFTSTQGEMEHSNCFVMSCDKTSRSSDLKATISAREHPATLWPLHFNLVQSLPQFDEQNASPYAHYKIWEARHLLFVLKLNLC